MIEKEILQLINRTETDRDHVLRLAAEHNADLHPWCVRRRRMHRLLADAVIVVSVAAFVVVSVLPEPDGRYLSSPQARKEVLNTINQTLDATL